MPAMIVELADTAATEEFGRDLAMALRPGDLVFLTGGLGAGKTTLSRAVIRQLADNLELEVPSPTFSLVQIYPAAETGWRGDIRHADFYRIGEADEIAELGLSDGPEEPALTLVEWPEIGTPVLPPPDLVIAMSDSGNGRQVAIDGEREALTRLRRSLSIRNFIDDNWQTGIRRHTPIGDASTRRYEHLTASGTTRLLMDAPKQADGPPIRDGKPYSRIAHLAEDVHGFLAIREILEEVGLSVPKLYAAAPEDGLLLLEHLGVEGIVDADRQPIASRYAAAAEMLAGFHRQKIAPKQTLAGGRTHQIPAYDRDALGIEVELLLDWYAPAKKGAPPAAGDRQAFLDIWARLFDRLEGAEKRLVLRDFHSPNILWLAKREGAQRIGLIDFQDAVIGPSAYDLASLAQDARVDVSPVLEARLIEAYLAGRDDETGFDAEGWRTAYTIMAAQRATKILGIFTRLYERDGKADYLRHLPRIEGYLRRGFGDPALAEYEEWYQAVIGL